MVQQFFVTVITSNEASIYSSAYSNDIVHFPTFGEWISSPSYWIYIPLSFIIVYYSTKVSNIIGVLIKFFWITLLLLTFLDLIGIIYSGEWGIEIVFQCLFANIFGSLALSSGFTLSLFASEKLSKLLIYSQHFGHILAALAPLAIGIVVSVVIYLLLSIFYNVTPSKVHIVAKAPFSGSYGVDDSSKKQNFGFLAEASQRSPVHWTGFTEPFELSWFINKPKVGSYTVGFFQGCYSFKDLKSLGTVSPHIMGEVSSFKMRLDKGMAGFSIEGGENLRLTNQNIAHMFWVKDNEKQKGISISIYKSFHEILEFQNHSEIGYLIYFSLVDSKGPTSRELELSIDGKKMTLIFEPSPLIRRDSKGHCASLLLPSAQKTVLVSELFVGAIVRISPSGPLLTHRFKPSANTKIKGFEGWLTADAPKTEDISKIMTTGALTYLSLKKGISELWLDGEKKELSELSNTVVQGEFSAQFNDNGALNLNGSGLVSVNQQRLSKTRWEKVGWEAKLVLFGGLPTFFVWLLHLLIRLVKLDYGFSVLSQRGQL